MSLYISVMRHATPEKNPDGSSADALAPNGIEEALDVGRQYDGEQIYAYHSPKNRAFETAQKILEGARSSLTPIESAELAAVAWSDVYKNKHLMVDGQQKPYQDVIDSVIENPIDEETGTNHYDDSVAGVKKFISMAISQHSAEARDRDVYVEGVSHGPKVEISLIQLLQDCGRDAYSSVDINDGFTPAENYVVKVDEESGELYLELHYGGEEIELPLDSLERRAAKFEEETTGVEEEA
jgi:broad specificity phosphatase PhoE